MSASSATAHAHDMHAGHHELGFVRTYIFSTDHKMIARQFLFMGLFMMVLVDCSRSSCAGSSPGPRRPCPASVSARRCCSVARIPSAGS